MKKKKYPKNKFKFKYEFSKEEVYKKLRRQIFRTRKPQNIISFVKKFRFFNLSKGYNVASLLGLKPMTKLNFLNNLSWRIVYKMLLYRFFFDYDEEKDDNFETLKTLVIYKSLRYSLSFPMRGQRTKTNAKTRKKYSIV